MEQKKNVQNKNKKRENTQITVVSGSTMKMAVQKS